MSTEDLLAVIEEGLENGRITPYLAAYIAAEVTGVAALATGFDDRVRLDDLDDER
ncbi:MAG: hypothetical protein IPP13_08715 [Kouleothrix sp.]|jgi:hypothetical protein|nr:hypothetical protein [Kouleothrix sp.]